MRPAGASPARPRIFPTRKDLSYGAGGLLDSWGLMGFKNLAHQVLNLVLGVNPALIGTVLALLRVWDAVADPLAGNISDNLRTRWGRRKPLIIAGAVLCGLTFPLCWWVPEGLKDGGHFALLMTTGLVFYTSFAVYTVAYYAFGYEIVPGYNEKTRLFAVKISIGTLTGFAVAWVFPLIQSGWLGDPRTSVTIISWSIGGILMLSGCAPALLIPNPKDETSVTRQHKIPVLKAIKASFGNRPFLIIAMVASLATAGVNAVTVLGTYVNIYYVHGGDMMTASVIAGIQFTVSTIYIVLCTPLMEFLSRLLGKRGGMWFCLGLAIVGSISKWFFYNPDHPYWIMGVVIFLGPANAGVRTFADSMVADACEYEKRRTGERHEAMYGAVYAWMLKMGLAAAALVSGFLITTTGFDVSLGSGQSEGTLLGLRLSFSFLPLIALVLACVLLKFYDLNRGKLESVREAV